MALTQEQGRQIIIQTAIRNRVNPALALAVWEQESGKSTDITLAHQELSRGRGHAVGPFGIVPFYHPKADLSSFESQADYFTKLLAKGGLAGYYGTGKPPPGFPTTAQYIRQIGDRVKRISGNNRLGAVTEGSFGNHTIDIVNPAGFELVPKPPLPGFSKAMQQILMGTTMNDDDENLLDPNAQTDPNTSILGQLLNAQQQVGQRQPNDFMSNIASNPLLHIGLGIMAGKGSFAQQIGAGALMGMKSYTDYQAASQEAQLSTARLGIQAMNAQTAASVASDRMLKNTLSRQAMADLPPDLQPYAQMKEAGIPEDVIKTKMLEQMGFPPALAAQLAIAGRNPGQGIQYKNVGGAVVEQRIDEKGNIVQTVAPEGPQQQAERSAGGMAFSQEYQKGLAKEVAPIQVSMARIPEFERKVAKIDDLIARLQASDTPLSGPLVGPALAAYDTFLGELRNFNIIETLEQIANSRLAPVSNVDFAVVSEGIASPSRTKDQNITFLTELRKAYIQRMRGLQQIQQKRDSNMSWDDILADYAREANLPPANKEVAPADTAYPGRGKVYMAPRNWEQYPPPDKTGRGTAGGTAAPAPTTNGIPPPGTREVQPDGSVIIW